MKDKIKNKIFHFFFTYEMTEEEIKRERKNDYVMSKVFGFLFLIGSMMINYLFFTGEFSIFRLLDLLLMVSSIAAGLLSLLFDWQNKF
ncbi:hypothetical protein [Neobacillus niacini]|uniref:hypothetical protein n=1 Tax=Neobacillus niacini TaxID=86668 RepID=UPI0021CB79EE|nr:hypothetical protein [Neobacillus niacini]MCM3768152.1 hypothetical protein [Neobacillus niacini]